MVRQRLSKVRKRDKVWACVSDFMNKSGTGNREPHLSRLSAPISVAIMWDASEGVTVTVTHNQ